MAGFLGLDEAVGGKFEKETHAICKVMFQVRKKILELPVAYQADTGGRAYSAFH